MKENILSQLDRVRQTGQGQYTACCPAHDDNDPSLSLYFHPDGRVLLHCFAGCDVSSVLGAMGLTLGDLYPEPLQHRLMGGTDRLRQRKVDQVNDRERMILAMAEEDRKCGKRLSVADLKREREAYWRVKNEGSR